MTHSISDIQVVWYGFIHESTGYSEASREYILALDKAGVDVKVQPLKRQGIPSEKIRVPENKRYDRINELIEKPEAFNKTKVMIYHAQPDGLNVEEARRTYKFIVINTVWETTHIPNSWVDPSNKVDAIFVPSTQNIEAFKDSGVTTPIFLAPHGSNTNIFNLDNVGLPITDIKGKFTFLSVFGWQHRKAPDVLLKAFWQEFKKEEPVALIIKTQIGATKGQQRHAVYQLSNWKAKQGFGSETADVIIATNEFNDVNIQSLYACADVFVLPTRGEGVGLPFIEALSSGIPVIATGWGGQMDFLNSRNSYFVDYSLSHCTEFMKEAIAEPFDQLFTDSMNWAEPNTQSLREQMRHVYTNQDEARQKGLQGRSDMEKMTWDIAGEKMKEAIEKALCVDDQGGRTRCTELT